MTMHDKWADDVAFELVGYLEDENQQRISIKVAQSLIAERKRCHDITLAVDSKRGNEELIAAAIMGGE